MVEVCPERRVDIRSAVAEVPLPGRVNAEEVLRALVIEELADLPAEPDCGEGVYEFIYRWRRTL